MNEWPAPRSPSARLPLHTLEPRHKIVDCHTVHELLDLCNLQHTVRRRRYVQHKHVFVLVCATAWRVSPADPLQVFTDSARSALNEGFETPYMDPYFPGTLIHLIHLNLPQHAQ